MTGSSNQRRLRITWPITTEAIARIRAYTDHEVVVGEPTRAEDDLMTDVLIGRPSGGPDWYPRLRWLQVPFAGVEQLGIQAWSERGVTVTNARGVFAVSIAQYVLAAILAISEQHRDRHALQASGRWPNDLARYVGLPVRGRTLALIGYGGIARETARLAAAHGMRVVAVKARPEIVADTGFRLPGTGDPTGRFRTRLSGSTASLEVVRQAAYIVVTAPLTEASRGLVGARTLSACAPHAWLINVARGAVVDEVALLQALDAGRLAGAVLDVFDEEPLPSDHRLWKHPRVILTPHVAGRRSDEVFEALVAENLSRWRAGTPLLNVVDPDRGY